MQSNNQSNLRLGLGIVIGLILGLIIFWGFWPVRWTNFPLQDLRAQDKYEYVQTIAEAYFSTDDLGTAQARLGQLVGPEEEIDALVNAAIDKLDTTGPGRASLFSLSSALEEAKANPGGGTGAVPASPEATAIPTALPTAQPESSAEAGNTGINWGGTGLAGPLALILLAAALIVGGLFIAYRWAWSSSSNNPFGTSPAPSHNPARIPADAVGPVFPTAGRREQPFPPDPLAPDLPPTFTAKEADHDADYIFHRDYKGSGRPGASGRPVASGKPAASEKEEQPFQPTGPVSDFDAEPPLGPSLSAPFEEQTEPLRRREEPERPSSLIGRLTNAFGGETPSGATAKPQRSTVNFSPDDEGYFVAEFYAGDDFEIAKSINRGEQGYIGEGGMAVSKLNTGANAETATALEVWLFEKSQISTRAQHLLSPHLFQSGEWDRAKLEAGDPPPLEARKGLTFRLDGEEAVLHCRITDVDFMETGPPQSAFRRLRLEMVSEVK